MFCNTEVHMCEVISCPCSVQDPNADLRSLECSSAGLSSVEVSSLAVHTCKPGFIHEGGNNNNNNNNNSNSNNNNAKDISVICSSEKRQWAKIGTKKLFSFYPLKIALQKSFFYSIFSLKRHIFDQI